MAPINKAHGNECDQFALELQTTGFQATSRPTQAFRYIEHPLTGVTLRVAAPTRLAGGKADIFNVNGSMIHEEQLHVLRIFPQRQDRILK